MSTKTRSKTDSACAPEQQPEWFKQVMLKFDTKFDELKDSIKLNFAAKKADDAYKKAEEVEESVKQLQNENLLLKKEIQVIRKMVDNTENYFRRQNLIFDGMQEESKEAGDVCEKKLNKLLRDCDISATDLNFEKVHRLGHGDKKPRPLIARFSTLKDRQLVWSMKHKLKGSSVRVSEDFTQIVRNNRRLLFPILKAAKDSPEVTSATLTQDKLFINHKLYTVDNLDTLPESIQPHKVATVQNESALVFFTQHSIFSNFHPMPIKIEDKVYTCNEQYYQYKKASFFGDTDIMQKILETCDPFAQLSLGKRVKGYKREVWMKSAADVLAAANKAKYNQHERAKAALLASGGRRIGEASLDMEFGVGLMLNDCNVCDTSKWKGKNIMGKILTDIRTSLEI